MADPVAAAPAAPVTAADPVAAPAVPAPSPAAATVAAPEAAAPAPAAEAPLVDLFADPADKPADPAKPADKQDEAKPADPAAYEFKLPEGVDATPEALSEVSAMFAKAGVLPDQAQPLLDAHLAAVRLAVENAVKAGNDGWTKTNREWQAAVKADPEIGGAALEQNIAQTRKGAETLLGPAAAKELFAALNFTGAGNNPAIVKALHKAFVLHAPPTSVPGAPAGQRTARSAGATLYPTQVGLGNANMN